MRKNKALNLICGIFLGIGMLVMVIGIIIMIFFLKFTWTAVEVDAVITDKKSYMTYNSEGDVVYEYDVFVEYVYEGYTHEVKVHSNTYHKEVGDTVILYVNPDSPREVRLKNLDYLFSFIPIGIGLVFFMIGAIPMLLGGGKKSKQRMLKETGQRLSATIDDIVVNYNFNVNGRHPYRILCSYKESYSGVTYCFKSDNIWIDPYLVCDKGSAIDVYVEQDHYKKYFVDVDALAENRIEDYT